MKGILVFHFFAVLIKSQYTQTEPLDNNAVEQTFYLNCSIGLHIV